MESVPPDGFMVEERSCSSFTIACASHYSHRGQLTSDTFTALTEAQCWSDRSWCRPGASIRIWTVPCKLRQAGLLRQKTLYRYRIPAIGIPWLPPLGIADAEPSALRNGEFTTLVFAQLADGWVIPLMQSCAPGSSLQSLDNFLHSDLQCFTGLSALSHRYV